jgi:hypothetical protein
VVGFLGDSPQCHRLVKETTVDFLCWLFSFWLPAPIPSAPSDLTGLHFPDSLALWLSVEFGQWEAWKEISRWEEKRLGYLFSQLPPCFVAVLVGDWVGSQPLPSFPSPVLSEPQELPLPSPFRSGGGFPFLLIPDTSTMPCPHPLMAEHYIGYIFPLHSYLW